MLPKCNIARVITTIQGTPDKISQKRSIAKSIVPPKYPEIDPQIKPNTKQNAAVATPSNNDVLKPLNDFVIKS